MFSEENKTPSQAPYAPSQPNQRNGERPRRKLYAVLAGLLVIVVIVRLAKRIKANKEYEKVHGKIPKKERKTLFYNKKGEEKTLPTRKEDTEKVNIKSISKEKLAKQLSESVSKPEPVPSQPQKSSGPVNIGGFSFKKGGKKT